MKYNELWFKSNSTLFNPNSSNKNLYSSAILHCTENLQCFFLFGGSGCILGSFFLYSYGRCVFWNLDSITLIIRPDGEDAHYRGSKLKVLVDRAVEK
jgi:hypothetical protein